MKKLKLFALTAVTLMGASGVANAETAMLASDDFVGISFWLVSMAMLAATAFFFLEAGSVAAGWRTSIVVAGICAFSAPGNRSANCRYFNERLVKLRARAPPRCDFWKKGN